MSTTVYALLPTLARFEPLDGFRQRLARADAIGPGATHELAVGDCFRWPDRPLPVAALVREYLAHDAGDHVWMCADLAHVKPDMTGARMLACGNLDIDHDEAEALAGALRPLFDDDGMQLEATLPARWHLRLSPQAVAPMLDAPGQVLGDDLIRHLPEGENGRHWRQLLNEAQIVLHQHPVNRARARQGKPDANSLWMWGTGTLPAWVRSDVGQAYADDLLLTSMAARADMAVHPLKDFRPDRNIDVDTLLDLGQSGDPEACRDLLFGLLDGKRADTLVLHFASGERWRLRRGQRWRLWRRVA